MTRHTCTVVLVLVVLLVSACDAHRFRPRGPRWGTPHRVPMTSSRMLKQAGHVHIGPAGAARCVAQSGSHHTPALMTSKAANLVRFQFGGDQSTEQNLLARGRYVPRSAIPFDVTADALSRGRLFVSTPSARLGIPASLSTVPSGGATDAPLTPYPSLELHRTTEDSITDCSTQLVSITATAKTWSDDDTLYALDCGVVEITTNPKNVCPPKIITFDLRTDEIVNITIIENAFFESQYAIIWVEACPAGRLLAYSSDSLDSTLTVTDLTTGVSRHLTSPYIHPVPQLLHVAAGGPPYYMGDGSYGLSGDKRCDGKLYLQAFCSNIQAALDKKIIRDASDGDILDAVTQVALPGKLSGISGPLAVDAKGELLFFPIQDELAIYCWNTSKPHRPQNFRLIAQDSKRLQFVGNMKIDPTSQLLYILTNKFTSYVWNVTDYSEDNYYVLYINITGVQC
ncbi:protein yellow-like [Schistocerca piceifrons]|uniref:protein yellow-like n=1 Tax=Schistocerca piceifrons TaxID=274613 RepID=UPI001F5FE336|nr:protein yellow-like [Schistocerca piceifrons]